MGSKKAKRSGEKTFYPYFLDQKPGFFLNGFLYRLFKRATVAEGMKEKLRRMQKEGTVVYATKYRGQLDYLLYHYNFRRRRLPYPKIAFDLNMSILLPFTYFVKVVFSQISSILRHGRLPNPYQAGFYKRAILDRTPCLMFLIDPKGFVRRFIHSEKDHLQFLLETQKGMNHPIFVVPQLVLYQKTPEMDYVTLRSIFFGFKENPGVIRKIVLFFTHNRHAFIDFGEPINLKTYLETQPAERSIAEMSAEIRTMLIDGIDSQKRVILGPIMKSRQQLKENVLLDPRVKEKIETIATAEGQKVWQLRKKAGEFFDEIAADYDIAYVQFFAKILGWFWKKIYEGIDVDTAGLAKVREWARKGPLIYVPSHKSHIDYLILNYILHNNHMHIPRVAAGKNLAFWPMGHIFRKSGAFFIRRSFKQPRLYFEVFNRYIKALVGEGHPIEFFIEGGRSRNGKLVLPKTGFLSILLKARQEGFCKDLIFVPASIVYDRVIEEKSLLEEVGGGSKEKESLIQIIKARRFLKRRHGKVYLRFGEPFSLNEYLSLTQPSPNEVHRKLAFHLIQAINQVTLVTPLSLIATAILTKHHRGFLYSELFQTVETLLRFLKRHEFPVASSLADPSKAVQETLSILMNWKITAVLEGAEGEEEPFYYVEEDKKIELEYYKNNIIHFFILHAFVATSLLSGKEEIKYPESVISECTFLKNLFASEFVFDEEEVLTARVSLAIDYFLEAGFLSKAGVNGGYKITKSGFDKLPIWAALAKTFLESYWIAVRSMIQQKNKKAKKEDFLKQMSYLGRRYHKLGIVDHIGSLSRLNFTNAIGYIDKEIMKSPEGTLRDQRLSRERLSKFGQRLYELSRYGQ